MTYEAYVEAFGLDELPEELPEYFAKWRDDGSRALCDGEAFKALLVSAGCDGASLARIYRALEGVEENAELLRFSRFLVSDMCDARNRCDCDNYTSLDPKRLSGELRALYPLVMLIACAVCSMEKLRARGVPGRYFEDIPLRPLRSQLRKLAKGDCNIADFPWDMNFYTCSIFYLDRFYFIPFRYEEEPVFYRSAHDGRVAALWRGNVRVMRSGQLDGVNGERDPDAFTTAWAEDETSVTANPVDPVGLIRSEPVTLSKSEWKPALPEGSLTLAFHIPGGEGYEPARVRSSMLAALDFFGTYFPELDIKGFWSESWLYDPALRGLLPEDSRIIQVQKQFYCYPTYAGDEQIAVEVFGGSKPDLTAQGGNRLERGILDSLRRGERFHATGMVVLRQEAELIGSAPYQGRYAL